MKRSKDDSIKCSGCRICELSCCMIHYEGAFNPRKALIRVEIDRFPEIATPVSEFDVPNVCLQCDPAPCIESCSTEAFVWDKSLEIWKIDQGLCTGCGESVDECPYDMIRIDNEKAMKCDLCNGDPLCVHFCPTGALSFS